MDKDKQIDHLQYIIDDFSFFYNINIKTQSAKNIEDAMRLITSGLVQELGFGFSAVFLFYNGKKQVRLAGLYSESMSEIQEQISFPVDENGIISTLLKKKQPVDICLDESEHKETSEEKFFKIWGLNNSVVIPLCYREDIIGILMAQDKDKMRMKAARKDTLRMFANQLSISVTNLILMEKLRSQDRENRRQFIIARQIQQGLLIQEYPFSYPVKLFARNISMEHIGGDLYDIVHIDDTRVGLFIADVTGHGLPAALIMSMTLGIFRNIVYNEPAPDKLLHIINNQIIKNLGDDSSNFVTAFYAVIDTKNMTITCSRAGHSLPLLYRSDNHEIIELEPGGYFLGGLKDVNYKTFNTNINTDDILLLYTDGILECKNSDGEVFGVERLKAFLEENAVSPPDSIGNKLLKILKNFNQYDYPKDDWTLLIAKITEP